MDFANSTKKQRAISFPKFYVVERVTNNFDSRQDFYFRIHERKTLDYKDEQLGFVYLTGRHVDDKQEPCQDMNAPFEIFEDVQSIEYTVVSEKCDP